MNDLNGFDVDELSGESRDLAKHKEKCQVSRTLRAEWKGGARARVYSPDGKELFVGGEGEFGAMSVALASLLACEIDVLATNATLRGIELETLTVEGTGEFNYARYMNAAKEPAPGYQGISYTVRIKSKKASKEQLAELTRLCETASPVGDTFSRRVPLKLDVIVEP
ncbi:MAG TPA: OsmC family protein [Nitrososphaerales archaeon]|nr:OsmC family protein [Nitrososphaerales archaeon]